MASKKNYDEMYAELMAIVESLRSNEQSLDDAVSSYEKATKLVVDLEKTLEEAKNKIEIVKKK